MLDSFSCLHPWTVNYLSAFLPTHSAEPNSRWRRLISFTFTVGKAYIHRYSFYWTWFSLCLRLFPLTLSICYYLTVTYSIGLTPAPTYSFIQSQESLFMNQRMKEKFSFPISPEPFPLLYPLAWTLSASAWTLISFCRLTLSASALPYQLRPFPFLLTQEMMLFWLSST